MSISKTILLIGGSGFLGRNITNTLLTDCHKLIVLTRNRKNALDIFPNHKKIEFIEAVLSDIDEITEIIDRLNVDIVMHLAAGLIPSSDQEDFSEELTHIVLPTFKLLHILAQKKIKIIFFSSAGTVYGRHKNLITEKTELNPLNYYGSSKLLIEQHILLLSRMAGLIYVIVRPSNVYGKCGVINKQQGFIEVTVEKMLKGESIEIWGSGKQTRDFIHISDLCSIVGEIVSHDIKNEIFNVAYGKSYSLLQIIEILEKILNVKSSLVFYSKRKVDVEHVKFDISYIKSSLNYQPLGINDGIEIFVSNCKNKI
jgi:UDP-glucose 4-epimerase